MQTFNSAWTHSVQDSRGAYRTFMVYEDWVEVPQLGMMPGTCPKKHVRRLMEPATGEIVREWESQLHGSLMPYDFSGMQAFLEERYGPKKEPQMAYIQAGNTMHMNVSSGSGNWTINTPIRYTNDAVESVPGGVVSTNATYYAEAKYGGFCHYCTKEIQPGEPIWHRPRRTSEKRAPIWCGKHKDSPTATADGTDKNTEQDDMAQRQDFTFPYTGAEIAASLERKAAKLDAQQQTAPRIDRDTAALLGYSSDEEYERLVKDKAAIIATKNERLAKEAAALRKEAIPYAKASKAAFEIDLEDIEFFGLNDDDAPAATVKPRRTRRTKEQIEADKAAKDAELASV
jgi:hypothetical protein